MFLKFAKADVLGLKSSSSQIHEASLSKFADYEEYRTDDDYVYVRVRAISSRVNKNHDGWPADELQKSYKTFIGKPIFVDHHNDDPKAARGVIVDAALHVEDLEKVSSTDPYYASAPDEHKPPTWVELLLEVDAKSYPKLAKAIVNGDIDGVSMGCNVEKSKCSVCANWASSPEEYCSHIRSKGAYYDHKQVDGSKISKRSYEDCYDIGFFEISFVFDPADETALVRDIRTSKVRNEVRNEYVATDGLYDYEADGFGADLSNVSPGLLQLATSAFEDGMARGGDEGSAWRFANQTLANAGYDPMQINAALTKVTEQFQGLIQHFQDNSDSIGQDQPYEGMPKPQSLPVFNDLEGQSPWNNPTLSRKTAEYHYVKKHGDKWVIIQKGTGKVLSTHDSEGQAKASFRAMETHKHEGATYLADRESPLPQSELIVAPTKVDTLRQEQTCPICGSVMDDGMCGVCNYEEPPEGFDNPDLQKARELDDQEKQQVGQPQPEQEQNQQAPPTGGPTGGLPPGAAGPSAQAGMGMAASTNKNRPAQAVTSDMSDWRVTLQSRTAGNNTSGGRINTQERPILPVTRQNSDKPLNPKVISDSRKPVESKTKENQLSRTRKVADGATPWGSGTSADERVDVTGIGAVDDSPEKDTRHENVEKAMSQEAGPHTDTWNGNEGDSLGQHDPVTDVASDDVVGGPIGKPVATAGIHTSLLPAHEADGTWGDPGEGSGKAFPDHEPTRIDVAAPLLEEVGDPTKTFGGDDFHLTNPITDQDSNEVGGPMGDPLSQEPAAKSSSVKAHIFRAIRLADAEVELGLTEKAEKWNRADELESQSPDALDAVEAMVKKVANSETIRTARTSASRMPSLQRTASIDPIEHAVTDTGGAEGLFL